MIKGKPNGCFVFGLGSMLKLCTEKLLNHPAFEVLGFISADEDAIEWARKKGLHTLQLADKVCYDLNGKDIENFLTCTDFDYFFSIVNAMKLPSHIINLPKKMAINFHDSELPKYAGVDATTWAIMKQEARHAVTWHSMNDVIDEGEIVYQQCFAIDHDDTAFSLNGKCFEAGLQSFDTLIMQIETGQLKTHRQDLTKRSYYSRYKPFTDPQLEWNHGIIDWQQSAEAIDALIRSLDFGPYRNSMVSAKIKCQDRYLIIERSTLLSTSSSQPAGTIVSLSNNSFTVATSTNDIVLSALKHLDGRTFNVVETAEKAGLKLGGQLAVGDHNRGLIYSLDKRCIWNERYWAYKILQARYSGVESGQTRSSVKLEKFSIHCSDNIVSQLSERQRPVQLLALFQLVIAAQTQSSKTVIWVHLPQLTHDFRKCSSLFAMYYPAIVTLDLSGPVIQVAESIDAELQKMSQKGGFHRDLLHRFPELRSDNGWFDYNQFGFSISSANDIVHADESFGIKLEVDSTGTQLNLIVDTDRYEHTVAEQWANVLTQAFCQIGPWSESPLPIHEIIQTLNQPEYSLTAGDCTVSDKVVKNTETGKCIMTRLWCELLEVNAPEMSHNFFDFGDSIKAIHFIKRINRETTRDLPLSIIYKYPTFGQFLEIFK